MNWRALFKANILNSAEDYIKSSSVHELQISEGHVTANVAGIENFHVEIDLAEDGAPKMNCNCPYAKTGSNCKHMAAVMFAWESSISSEKEIRTEIHSGEAGETNANATVDNNQDFKASQEIKIQDSVEMVSEEKKKEIIQRAKSRVELSCEIDDVLTYAIQHNGAYLIRDICVKNISENDIDNLVVRIDSNNELVELFEFGIQKIKPDEELHFKKLKIGINADFLASLTERSISKLKIKVSLEDEVLVSGIKDIAVLAFDQWPGLQYTPELLAAFAMPNHPVVISLLQLASKYLDTWTHEPSLAGYQFKDPNRVKTMAAAAYAAIQQKNITYAEPPSSFEVFGQRIRLADAVLEQHMGTCMDMSLLYVACLEAMGLNPVLIMMKGHIFAGVWLIEESFADMVMDDPSQLEKRMSKGIHELIVVECTAMCAGKTRSFDEAVNLAEHHVSDYGNFAFAIDVRRARSMGIRPLPVRVKTDAGFEVLHEDRKEKDITSAPEAIGETFNLSYSGEKKQATKQTQWERKLLDISMRNMLINLRMTKVIVPLLSSDAGILEDALADGEEFQVLPRPADMSVSGDAGVHVEALGELGPFADFIALESKHRRLHSLYTEKAWRVSYQDVSICKDINGRKRSQYTLSCIGAAALV